VSDQENDERVTHHVAGAELKEAEDRQHPERLDEVREGLTQSYDVTTPTQVHAQ